jgi:hypothetical protein
MITTSATTAYLGVLDVCPQRPFMAACDGSRAGLYRPLSAWGRPRFRADAAKRRRDRSPAAAPRARACAVAAACAVPRCCEPVHWAASPRFAWALLPLALTFNRTPVAGRQQARDERVRSPQRGPRQPCRGSPRHPRATPLRMSRRLDPHLPGHRDGRSASVASGTATTTAIPDQCRCGAAGGWECRTHSEPVARPAFVAGRRSDQACGIRGISARTH